MIYNKKMNDNFDDIIDEYFKINKDCGSINCQSIIFEPRKRREWFFDEGCWCYFDFLCEYSDYQLVRTIEKDFDESCYIKEMSYEIKMLLAYTKLRNVSAIEKEDFTRYVFKYENAKKESPNLTIEEFNINQKEKEDASLKRSDKIVNLILTGCLFWIGVIAALFIIAAVVYIKRSI